MAICRENVACEICKAEITLRVSISSNIKQHHHFSCPNCKSLLEFGYEYKNADDHQPTSIIIKNCYRIEKLEILEHVINLHPDFLIPLDKLNNPTFSTNIFAMQLAAKKLGDRLAGSVDSDAILHYWKTIKVEWDLFDNKKLDILHERYKEDQLIKQGQSSQDVFFERLFQFFHAVQISPKNDSLSIEFDKKIQSAMESNYLKTLSLIEFYQRNFYKEQLSLYKKAFTLFFDAYTDLRQLRYPMKIDLDTTNLVMTNYNFDLTEKIYSELFEIITKTVSGILLVARVEQGKKFDIFEKTTLLDFLNSSIQNKMKAFDLLGSKLLSPSLNIIDNDLRNAGSHRDMKFDQKNLSLEISHKDKKSSLSYLDYLKLCWEQINYISKLAIQDMKLYELRKSIHKKQKNPFKA